MNGWQDCKGIQFFFFFPVALLLSEALRGPSAERDEY